MNNEPMNWSHDPSDQELTLSSQVQSLKGKVQLAAITVSFLYYKLDREPIWILKEHLKTLGEA